jgi:hypothetical protein
MKASAAQGRTSLKVLPKQPMDRHTDAGPQKGIIEIR